MSCEQMLQYQTVTIGQGNAVARISNSNGTITSSATTDPYVFTEPPSVQPLQFNKNSPGTMASGPTMVVEKSGKNQGSPNNRASVYSVTGATSMKVPRHNVNESLKKKLGISHVKPVTAAVPATCSPMISGMMTGSPVAAQSPGGASNSSISGGRTKRTNCGVNRNRPGAGGDFLDAAVFSSSSNGSVGGAGGAVKTAHQPRTAKKTNSKRESKKNNLNSARNSVVAALNNSRTTTINLRQVPTFSDDLLFPRPNTAAKEDQDLAPLHIRHWFVPEFNDSLTGTLICPSPPTGKGGEKELLQVHRHLQLPSLSRDERLEVKRNELRRRTQQLRNGQRHREILMARRRFLYVQSVLLKEVGDDATVGVMDKSAVQRLNGGEKEEKIFAQVKCGENESQKQKEFLVSQNNREKSKQGDKLVEKRRTTTTTTTNSAAKKKNGVENKKNASSRSRVVQSSIVKDVSAAATMVVGHQPPVMMMTATAVRKNVSVRGGGQIPVKQQKRREVVLQKQKVYGKGDFVDEDDSVGLEEEMVLDEELEEEEMMVHNQSHLRNLKKKMAPKWKNYRTVVTTTGTGVGAPALVNHTDLLLVSENSSAYESSEDTGVGGLSESEMIEEIGFDSQFLEDPEFNNVLEDLLAVEQHGEMFDDMSVDDDVKTLEMTGTSTFLGDFLADQMLRDSDAAATAAAIAGVGNGAHHHHLQQQQHHHRISSAKHGHGQLIRGGNVCDATTTPLIQT